MLQCVQVLHLQTGARGIFHCAQVHAVSVVLNVCLQSAHTPPTGADHTEMSCIERDDRSYQSIQCVSLMFSGVLEVLCGLLVPRVASCLSRLMLVDFYLF